MSSPSRKRKLSNGAEQQGSTSVEKKAKHDDSGSESGKSARLEAPLSFIDLARKLHGLVHELALCSRHVCDPHQPDACPLLRFELNEGESHAATAKRLAANLSGHLVATVLAPLFAAESAEVWNRFSTAEREVLRSPILEHHTIDSFCYAEGDFKDLIQAIAQATGRAVVDDTAGQWRTAPENQNDWDPFLLLCTRQFGSFAYPRAVRLVGKVAKGLELQVLFLTSDFERAEKKLEQQENYKQLVKRGLLQENGDGTASIYTLATTEDELQTAKQEVESKLGAGSVIRSQLGTLGTHRLTAPVDASMLSALSAPFFTPTCVQAAVALPLGVFVPKAEAKVEAKMERVL